MTNPQASTPQATTLQSRTFGQPPRVNTELVTDYALPETDTFRHFMRIHLDIPVAQVDFGEFRLALDKSDTAKVASTLKARLNNEGKDWKRCRDLVDLAFPAP